MRILITGCNGQLGNEMRVQSIQHPRHEYLYADIVQPENSPVEVHRLDITDRDAVHHFVQEQRIDLIVNCAAYTNVDKAEEDEMTARKINAEAVENLGTAGCRLIHISTDYVFSGDEHVPCREDDSVAPRTAYGRTKWEGEERLHKVNPAAIVIRTAWLYSAYGNNFVKTMLRLGSERDNLGVVFDQIGTPTYAADLATAIYTIIETPQWKPGTYHFTNEGVCSWYDFTVEILRQAKEKTGKEQWAKVRPILSSEYQYKTPRPHYSVLDKGKIKRTFDMEIPYWTDGLHRCLCEIL